MEESTIHALWSCPSAQDVWGCGPILFQNCPTNIADLVDLLVMLLNRLDEGLSCLIAILAHRIWCRRNRVVFEDTFSPPSIVFSEASKAFDDFLLCSHQEKDVVVLNGENTTSSKSRKAPGIGFFKVNWDASLNRMIGFIGLGCVIRNSEGQVLV
jgi:hypothetical protein